MSSTIVVVGTLDTKGSQIAYLKDVLERRGAVASVIDIGVLAPPPFEPMVTRERVAEASGMDLGQIIGMDSQHEALVKMSAGARTVVQELYESGKLDAIIGLGGSMGSSAVLGILNALPLGVPKVLVSTLAYSPMVGPDLIGGTDLITVPWIGGLWGLNKLSRSALDMAAGAAIGAAQATGAVNSGQATVGVTALGSGISPFLGTLERSLAKRGYGCAVFHSIGMDTRAFERAIRDGLLVASLDLSAGVDLLDQVVDSPAAPAPDRLEAAGELGIPQIVSPGEIGVFHWGGRPLPPQYQDRPYGRHNPIVLSVLSDPSEMGQVGELMALKLNRAKGPTAVVIPMGGLHGSENAPPRVAHEEIRIFLTEHVRRWTAGIEAFRARFTAAVDPRIRVEVLEESVREPAYANKVLELFDEMVGGRR
jgi:uncharacterized protein (UPF0261 family)